MRFYSTRNKEKAYSLKDAVIMGMPEDGGLFMPEKIPVLDEEILADMDKMSFREIAFHVLSPFTQEVEDEDLHAMWEDIRGL